MDWDDLRVFLAVARDDSLSRAGKRLAMDPSTVSRRVARLEAALGHPLFLKSPQGYALTPEGARLFPHAEAAELALSGAEESLGRPGELTGQLRIGAPDGCANYLLPQVAAALCAAHPGLEIQIVALPRVFNLTKREADFAIAVSRPETGRLVVQRLCDYRLHLAAHERYLARHGPIDEIGQLRAARLIGYIPDMIFDQELDYLGPLLHSANARPAQLTSNSVSVQMQAIRTGAGIGIVHDFAIPFTPGVRRVLPEAFGLTRSFWMIRHADDRRSDRLNRLADELAQGLRAEVARLESAVDSDGGA
ncbi:DNA-binding transcriptional regulator, LysR family [Paracoccus isoporae]|uniref:DNA-binding transcriptional regulator, LysR family n=1 Tax=Paracoccus isoporae TaxID=591205 RepID=A0A1G7AUE1_9RHOB|nr:LysR family transcriptional regulator [Paracoccus isoporae]SDE18494.1 DNA-binding transcriptional regulator, LysR family [Paracoccus isoporae]